MAVLGVDADPLFAGVLPQEFWRVHENKYGPAQFNPSPAGDARFSPISNAAGSIIPVLYAGDTRSCALMETVLRDVPLPPGDLRWTWLISTALGSWRRPSASRERSRLLSSVR